MHGRLKVKTTAQQDAEKKQQRNEKLEAYEKAMQVIFATRKSLQIENSPNKITMQLRATSGVLLANPDITTLWNIRKEMLEIILSFFGNFAPSNINDHDSNLKKELDLTLQCLQNNPKSYGAWHHRCWSMLKMKNPNWDNELALCNKYLSLDERNFHCWDYRRFVVKHNVNISAQDELNYSYEKIEEKIENYSAWHYRSKLLPQTDPSSANNGAISEAKRREELDMVLNAVFTDPADSSAWIYHKWLLASPNIDATRPICALLSEEKTAITIKEWRSVAGQKFDSLWISELILPASTTVCVEMVNGSSSDANQSISVVGDKVCHTFQQSDSMDQETYKVLEKELENCNLLLDPEMELLEDDTNTKWPLYTKVLIMKAMDPDKFHDEIVADFDELCQVDEKRKGYYKAQ